MRIAIISDLHLGDTNSAMAFRDEKTGKITKGCKYEAFKNGLKEKTNGEELDYLVLLGDILDFSVASYNDAYGLGKFFFQALKDENIAKEMIYAPGNHDFDLWHTIEYEANITRRFEHGKLPIPLRMSIPGIIDDRPNKPTTGFYLHNVTRRKEKNKPKYGGLFLDKITEPSTPFNFVYPNIYLITPEESILVTHGHYLEMYWSIIGRAAVKLMFDDLKLKIPGRMDLKEMVAINSPSSVLACSAIGQAGPLTDIIQKGEHEIKENDVTRVEKYLDRLYEVFKENTSGFWGWIQRLGYKLGQKELLKVLATAEDSRYNEEFLKDPAVRRRCEDFLQSTVYEIGQIEKKYGTDIPVPTSMIFGHTHQPIAWQSPEAPAIQLPIMKEGELFRMYNTGGWLMGKDENNQSQFCGAEIFYYETDKGISSVSIR